jgi:DNA-binding transcriptional ArsR family regulator
MYDKGVVMAKAKTEEFTDKEVQLADLAKALSHPARVRILNILFENNICMTGDIVDLLPLSQSTVSQHLIELKKVGLIKGEIEGPRTCYCLDNKMVAKASAILNNLFNKICNC